MTAKILLAALLGLIVVVSGCASQQAPPSTANLDAFAQCLTEKGVNEYGAYTCSACAAQKKSFGDSYKYINYIECNPRGPNQQADLCVAKGIEKTPTWMLEQDGKEVKRLEGFQVFEDLAAFSGCSLS